jgi:hypothetical protein
MSIEVSHEAIARAEYEVDYARTHVQAVLAGLADGLTREWSCLRLEQADELLTSAVQRLWHELGLGRLPVGTLKQQADADGASA